MLNLTNLIGFGAGDTLRIKTEFIATAVKPLAAADYTFFGMNIGVPAADRLVVVVICRKRNDSVSLALTGVTIAGVAATIIGQHQTGGAVNCSVAIAYALVPAGSTGDIAITAASESMYYGLWVYTVTGTPSGVTFETATDTGSVAVSSLFGSGLIGGASDAAGATLSVSGAFVDDGEQVRADFNYRSVGFHLDQSSGADTLTLSESVRALVIAKFHH